MATLTDGQFLTLTAGEFVAMAHGSNAAGRTLSARVDLSDDRSFLSSHHRDLVDMVPDLGNRHGTSGGQGWLWIGTGNSSCEIHVVLGRVPPSIDLILGRCALELIDGARPHRASDKHRPDRAGDVVDLRAARDARSHAKG